MDANLHIVSDLVDGAIIHPTLPMSYLGEIVDIPADNVFTKDFTYNFTTINSYTDPFFILTTTASRIFYFNVTGSGQNFQFTCMRSFKYAQGVYIIYSGENGTNKITKPILEGARLYVGGSRG